MSKLSEMTGGIWRLLTAPGKREREILKESRPFLVFMTIVLVAMSVVILVQAPHLTEPRVLAVFALLMGLHILLHWFSGLSSLERHWSLAYLITQGLLAAGLVLYTREPTIGFALFSALIGETIGVYGLSWLAASAVAAFLLIQQFSFFLINGMDGIRDFGTTSAAINVLLIVMMVLIRRVLDSGDQAKMLLGELEKTHQLLANYAAQVETLTLTAERERMARDLHDTLAQGLAGLVMQLEAANHHLKTGNTDRAMTILDQAMERSRSTLSGVRQAIDDLRSAPDIELDALIRQRTARFSEATGIPCDVELGQGDHALNLEVRDHLDRILGESLANIAVHAAASHVTVRLSHLDGLVQLEIADDGIGFDAAAPQKSGHYGLIGMRERARLAGGRFDIVTAANQGCRILVHLPAGPTSKEQK